MRSGTEDLQLGSIPSAGVSSQRGQNSHSGHRALETSSCPALSPPQTCGPLLCRWRREAEPPKEGLLGEEETEKGREESTARATSLLFQRHIVQETKPGRAGAHTRTHGRRPGRLLSVSLRGRESRPSFALLRTRSSAGSQRSSEPKREVNAAGGPRSISAACQAESSHSVPSPAQNSDLSPTPPLGGFTRTAPRNQGRVIGFGIHISALRTAPRSSGLLGFSGWRACSRARNSCLRSSGKGPSKQWPLRVPRASSLPVSQPASH